MTGDEPQGTMGRVQPLRAHRERRLGTRQSEDCIFIATCYALEDLKKQLVLTRESCLKEKSDDVCTYTWRTELNYLED